jgi:hypothetical protein
MSKNDAYRSLVALRADAAQALGGPWIVAGPRCEAHAADHSCSALGVRRTRVVAGFALGAALLRAVAGFLAALAADVARVDVRVRGFDGAD